MRHYLNLPQSSLQQAEVSLVQCTCMNMVNLGVVDNLWDLSILH